MLSVHTTRLVLMKWPWLMQVAYNLEKHLKERSCKEQTWVSCVFAFWTMHVSPSQKRRQSFANFGVGGGGAGRIRIFKIA